MTTPTVYPGPPTVDPSELTDLRRAIERLHETIDNLAIETVGQTARIALLEAAILKLTERKPETLEDLEAACPCMFCGETECDGEACTVTRAPTILRTRADGIIEEFASWRWVSFACVKCGTQSSPHQSCACGGNESPHNCECPDGAGCRHEPCCVVKRDGEVLLVCGNCTFSRDEVLGMIPPTPSSDESPPILSPQSRTAPVTVDPPVKEGRSSPVGLATDWYTPCQCGGWTKLDDAALAIKADTCPDCGRFPPCRDCDEPDCHATLPGRRCRDCDIDYVMGIAPTNALATNLTETSTSLVDRGSSNGRTRDFDSRNGGSNPSPRTDGVGPRTYWRGNHEMAPTFACIGCGAAEPVGDHCDSAQVAPCATQAEPEASPDASASPSDGTRSPSDGGAERCTFCNQPAGETTLCGLPRKVISGPEATICVECARLCMEVFAENEHSAPCLVCHMPGAFSWPTASEYERAMKPCRDCGQPRYAHGRLGYRALVEGVVCDGYREGTRKVGPVDTIAGTTRTGEGG